MFINSVVIGRELSTGGEMLCLLLVSRSSLKLWLTVSKTCLIFTCLASGESGCAACVRGQVPQRSFWIPCGLAREVSGVCQ